MLSRSVKRVAPSLTCTRGYAAPTGSKGNEKSGDPTQSSFKLKRNEAKRSKRPRPIRDMDTSRKGTFTELPSGVLKSPLTQDRPKPMELPEYSARFMQAGYPIQPVALVSKKKDPLHKYGVPRNLLLDSRFFPRLSCIIRDVSKNLATEMNSAATSPSSQTRMVLHGSPGCGKSYALLQTAHHCNRRNWIVMYIPRAIKLVDSSTSYEYDGRTQTYLQHDFAREILTRLLDVEGAKLAKIPVCSQALAEHPSITIRPQDDLTVATLIPNAVTERSPAMDYLEIVFASLGKQIAHPVLLAIDDFQALYRQTLYRNPQFYPLESYHLSIPRLLLQYASGQKSFARGAVVGAESTTDKRFDTPLEIREEIGMPTDQPASLWSKRHQEYVAYAKGLRGFEIASQLTLEEATALFELWKSTGVLAPEATDELFLSKYTEASGNARDFVWKGLLATIEG